MHAKLIQKIKEFNIVCLNFEVLELININNFLHSKISGLLFWLYLLHS